MDMSRRSLTYEKRLYKYSCRGFSVGVPGLNMNYVDNVKLKGISLGSFPFWKELNFVDENRGLTKLLVHNLKFKPINTMRDALIHYKKAMKVFEAEAEIIAEPKMKANSHKYLPLEEVI